MIYAVNKRTKEHKAYSVKADLPLTVMSGNYYIVEADADGWIPYTGTECPLPDDARCDLKTNCNTKPYYNTPTDDAFWGKGSTITHYRPIIEDDTMSSTAVDDQLAPEPMEWQPAAGKPARALGVDCTVLAIDTNVGEAAVQWWDGGIAIVSLARIKPRPTARERWVNQAAREALRGGETLGILYDALLNGTLDVPGREQPAVDMTDPENWQEGDVIECLSSKLGITRGKAYEVRPPCSNDDYFSITDDDGDYHGWTIEGAANAFRFIRRP